MLIWAYTCTVSRFLHKNIKMEAKGLFAYCQESWDSIIVMQPLATILFYTSNNQRLQSAGNNDQSQFAFAPMLCVFRKFHLMDSQNTHDQITSDRRSKCVWSNCILCIPLILSGSPNESCLHTCDACVITTWRLGLRSSLAARNYIVRKWVIA